MNNVVKDMLDRFQVEYDLVSLKQTELFEAFAAYCIIGNLYPHDFDPDQVRIGAAGDLGIDAAAIFINGTLYTDPEDVRRVTEVNNLLNVHFVFVQAKTTAAFDPTVFTDIAENLDALFTSRTVEYPTNAKVRDLHECVRIIYSGSIEKLSDQRPQVSVWYVTPGVVKPETLAARQQSAKARLEATNLFGPVGFYAVGAAELAELYDRSAKSATSEFSMRNRVQMPTMPGVHEAYLGLLPARVFVEEILRDPLGHIRTSIFNDNVRDFLGYGVTDREGNGESVNAGIRSTLKDPMARARFPVLNNGITIIARKMTVVGNKVRLSDFQVVNGCQTSYVLFDRHKAGDLPENVLVTVRIIESDTDEVISGIVEATNRQNKFTVDGLAIREQFHKDLERHFPAQPTGRSLYYERRVGQYNADDTKVEKTRVITHSQLTKAYAAMFLDEASRVGQLRQLLIARAAELYQGDHDKDAYYAAASAYYRLGWLIRNDRIQSTYSPAKYHMIACARLLLLGPDRVAKMGTKAASKAFQTLIDAMWDVQMAEKTFGIVVPAIHDAIHALNEDAGALPSLVRTERFGAALRSEILKRGAPA